MAEEEENSQWLLELLRDVQLEQFYSKLRDDLQVTRSVFQILNNAIIIIY